jgi:hypothetical protein
MARLEIYTEKGSLDLPLDAANNFYITRQVHDLRSFISRNADYTSNIDLPATENNLNEFNAAIDVSNAFGNKVTVRILMDGVQVAPVATALHLRTRYSKGGAIPTMEIIILYGNFNFFDSIREGDISDLNWADLAIEWEAADVAAIGNNEQGIVFPQLDWAGDSWVPNGSLDGIDINRAGFWVYAHEVVRRIITEAGFIPVERNLPEDYYDFALCCPVTAFADPYTAEGESDSYYSAVKNNPIMTARGEVINAPYDEVVSGTLWNATGFYFEIEVSATINITFVGIVSWGTTNPQTPDGSLSLMLNGVAQDTIVFTDQTGTDVSVSLSAQTAVLPGDQIWLEMNAPLGTTPDRDFQIDISPNSELTVGTLDNEDRTVQPSEWIPKIDQKEFLTGVLSNFNLVVTTDDITKEVTISRFNEVYETPEQDISRYLDVSDGFEIDNALESLAEQSIFKYQDTDLLFRADVNYIRLFDNEVLDLQSVVLEMPYGATDITPKARAAELPTSLIPLIETSYESIFTPQTEILTYGPVDTFTILEGYGLEFEVGDWIDNDISPEATVPSTARRIIEKTSDLTGRVSVPFGVEANFQFIGYSITKYATRDVSPRVALVKDKVSGVQFNVSQGGWSYDDPFNTGLVQVPAPGKVASFGDSLLWEDIIENTYYRQLMNAFDNTQVLRAWFALPVSVFEALDFSRPVYLDFFKAAYYINKIEQYKVGRKVRIELIRISDVIR